ncbi:unnamed protein product [Brugia pahangi]|uniref:Secreted protein n=1 Tax=Brugia pahangi TaxID=6280 RepID=A0A0N4TGV0_BRUPA|nr:unnamed protein product [Brugia pahangi]
MLLHACMCMHMHADFTCIIILSSHLQISFCIHSFLLKLVTVEGFIITNQKQQVQRQVSTKVTTAGATHQQCIIPVTSSHQTVCAKSISQGLCMLSFYHKSNCILLSDKDNVTFLSYNYSDDIYVEYSSNEKRDYLF